MSGMSSTGIWANSILGDCRYEITWFMNIILYNCIINVKNQLTLLKTVYKTHLKHSLKQTQKTLA